MGNYSESSLLFVEPSALLGASRVLDLGATAKVYNYSDSDMQADCRALASDWRAVGRDLRTALKWAESVR